MGWFISKRSELSWGNLRGNEYCQDFGMKIQQGGDGYDGKTFTYYWPFNASQYYRYFPMPFRFF
jgi:hypothetical protein